MYFKPDGDVILAKQLTRVFADENGSTSPSCKRVQGREKKGDGEKKGVKNSNKQKKKQY